MFPPAPSLCHSFSCTHHHCQSSSLYTIFLLFFICHSSFTFFFSLPLPVSFSLLLPLSLSLQAAREKENSQAQLKALSQQTEAARRELAEILGRLAQREEELHRKDVELSETHQRQLSLQQEIREVWGPTPRQISSSSAFFLITRILKYASVFSNVQHCRDFIEKSQSSNLSGSVKLIPF